VCCELIYNCGLTRHQEKAENLITLPESSAVIESIIAFCYSPHKEPKYPEAPEGRHISHWAEVFIVAEAYQFDDQDNREDFADGGLRFWASKRLISCIDGAEQRLLSRHDGTVDISASKELQALWKKTDFEDLVRAVDILWTNSLDDEDDLDERLRMIDWAGFAVGAYRKAWLDLITKHPAYAASLVDWRSEDAWIQNRINQKERKEAAAAAKKHLNKRQKVTT